MCNKGNKQDDYKAIINYVLDYKLQDTDSIVNIKLSTSDIAGIIEQYLEQLTKRGASYISCAELAEKLGVFQTDIFETIKQMITYELTDTDTLKRYINHQAGDPGIMAIFMSRSTVLNNYRYQVPIDLKEALIKYNYDTANLEETITNYLIDHNIQIDDCIISTVDAVGIVCKPQVDVLKELQSIIHTCINIIDDTVCEKAIQELTRLGIYLLGDAKYAQAESSEDRMKYKKEETFLESNRLPNIKIMIHNKEYFTKKEAGMYRVFYSQYDNGFIQPNSIANLF